MHRRSKQILVLFVLFLLGVSGCGQQTKEAEKEEITQVDLEETKEKLPEEKADEQKEVIFVYVCGQVAAPGVYKLSPDARIYEAVEAAGGILPEGSAESLNLAQTAEDGQKVYVPSREEAAANPAMSEPASGTGSGKVNLNTAGLEELMTLTGIGQTRAEAIIAYREEQGSFGSPEEIMEVDGIKEGIYEKLKDEITV